MSKINQNISHFSESNFENQTSKQANDTLDKSTQPNQSIEIQCEQCKSMPNDEKCFECKIFKNFMSLKSKL